MGQQLLQQLTACVCVQLTHDTSPASIKMLMMMMKMNASVAALSQHTNDQLTDLNGKAEQRVNDVVSEQMGLKSQPY